VTGVGIFALILGLVLWAIPTTAAFGKDIAVTGCLIASISFVVFAVVKPAKTSSRVEQASASTVEEKPVEPPKVKAPLKISSWKCTHAYGFMTLEGEVLNRSDTPIDNLLAVGIFKTQEDEFIKAETALVEYQPLLPHQRSPFKVMAMYNPAMKYCSLGFKQMFGGKIASEE
jgi:hypothetical protein